MSTENQDYTAVFEQLAAVEREFHQVEFDSIRRKEFQSKPLYEKRQKLVGQIPEFWAQALSNAPEDIQRFFTPADFAILSCLKSFQVERYQIASLTEGNPCSLRFIFEFQKNEFIENTKLVKDFQHVPSDTGVGNLVSKPVTIKWKNKKNDVTGGLLDLANDLYNAEQSLKLKNGDKELEIMDREGLWQHEKLITKLTKLEEDPDFELSFFAWFGFRGAVDKPTEPKKAANGATNGKANGKTKSEKEEEEKKKKKEEGDESEVESVEEDNEDDMLDVEIFPAGEELAISLAEDFWPNVMDCFMQTDADSMPDVDEMDEDDESEDGDDEAPELVPAEELRPAKRQRQN